MLTATVASTRTARESRCMLYVYCNLCFYCNYRIVQDSQITIIRISLRNANTWPAPNVVEAHRPLFCRTSTGTDPGGGPCGDPPWILNIIYQLISLFFCFSMPIAPPTPPPGYFLDLTLYKHNVSTVTPTVTKRNLTPIRLSQKPWNIHSHRSIYPSKYIYEMYFLSKTLLYLVVVMRYSKFTILE